MGFVVVLGVHAGQQLGNGLLPVSDLVVDSGVEGFVLGGSGGVLGVQARVDGGDVSLATVVLTFGEVVDVGDLDLSRVVLGVSKVVEVGDLCLAGVVLALSPAVEGGDLGLTGAVLGVELALEFGDVDDASLVVLLLSLLQGLDLVLPQVVLPLHGGDEGVVVLPESFVVAAQTLDLRLAVIVGPDKSVDGILELVVEVVAGVVGGVQIALHGSFT